MAHTLLYNLNIVKPYPLSVIILSRLDLNRRFCIIFPKEQLRAEFFLDVCIQLIFGYDAEEMYRK